MARRVRSGLTYPSVGASLDGQAPRGFRREERTAVVGAGEADFRRAADATRHWGIQEGAGIRVIAPERALRDGDDVVMRVPLWPRDVPCRVVLVVDEPRRAGFAYGTLPGHPERGEEAFVVEWGDDDVVRLGIRAFSRPASPVFWIGYPAVRLMQAIYTRRYLAALAEGGRGDDRIRSRRRPAPN